MSGDEYDFLFKGMPSTVLASQLMLHKSDLAWSHLHRAHVEFFGHHEFLLLTCCLQLSSLVTAVSESPIF